MSFELVPENTVTKYVQHSALKALELDPIPTSLLFESMNYVLPTLTQIVNDLLTSGIFQQIHRSAIVRSLLKKTALDHNGLKKIFF